MKMKIIKTKLKLLVKSYDYTIWLVIYTIPNIFGHIQISLVCAQAIKMSKWLHNYKCIYNVLDEFYYLYLSTMCLQNNLTITVCDYYIL